MMPNISLYFIRHGERVDQVDSSWATNSPCPYDPHLTNRGKTQARQTGKMIRDFAYESRSASTSVSRDSISTIAATDTTIDYITLQRITPPESPNLGRFGFTNINSSQTNHQLLQEVVNTRDSKRHQYFAIVTSPFLRCTQTAMEIAMGMKMNNEGQITSQDKTKDRDLVTIAVESGLTEWLSEGYVSGQVPDSMIVQRMQDFAIARRDHEQYYSIDWKYIPKDRQLPTWPESRESMQDRLDKTLSHVIQYYTSRDKDMERDLSVVFVTHASPVNALIEACIQSPVLVPVQNCSISRCIWTPLSEVEVEDQQADDDCSELGVSAIMQSKSILTLAGRKGRWLLDYQTYTAHLSRDQR